MASEVGHPHGRIWHVTYEGDGNNLLRTNTDVARIELSEGTVAFVRSSPFQS